MVSFVSWVFGLVADMWFITHAAPYVFILSWTALTFVAPFGLKGLTLWFTSKGGGTVDHVAAEAKEILSRRASVGGDHEPAL